MSKAAWMVRAGQNGAFAAEFVAKGVVAVGFGNEFGKVDAAVTKAHILKLYKDVYPSWKTTQVGNAASQMVRFLQEVSEGDLAVTYDPNLRRYFIGTIKSPATWDETKVPGYPWTRTVLWERRCSRDDLSITTRNTLGSTLTLFNLNKSVQDDLAEKAIAFDAPESEKPMAPQRLPSSEEAEWEELRTSFLEKAAQFIEDRIASLDPYEVQQLIAGVLRALGYRTAVSPKGADLGADVFASPDGLGLEQPRIFVEVKHQGKAMGAPDLRSFLGGRRTGDRCLYVSTGGFTKEAQYEAARADVPVTLINMPKLRQLVVEHYEKMDLDTRALVPLDRIYWPSN